MKTILTLLAMSFSVTLFASESTYSQCTYLLKNGRGHVLDTIIASGYNRTDACQLAQRRCSRVLMNGRHRGRNLHCQRLDLVTRTCTARMVSRRGRTIQYYTAQATGIAGSRVRQRACGSALRRCENARYNSGRRGASCTITRYNRPYPRPVPPRTRPLPPRRPRPIPPRTRPAPPRRRPLPAPPRRPGRRPGRGRSPIVL